MNSKENKYPLVDICDACALYNIKDDYCSRKVQGKPCEFTALGVVYRKKNKGKGANNV